jgi:hypothetical protein
MNHYAHGLALRLLAHLTCLLAALRAPRPALQAAAVACAAAGFGVGGHAGGVLVAFAGYIIGEERGRAGGKRKKE